MRPALAVWPSPDAPVSLASCLREMGEAARAGLVPPPFPRDAARGTGQPVIVLPGFCSADITTSRLREFLAHQGFSPRAWTCGFNLGPVPSVLAAIEKQVRAEAHAQKVALVGVSLGGTLAREIARRMPDRIYRVVTLASPVRLPVVSPLAPLAQAAALLWEAEARAALGRVAAPLPVPLTAIVSPSDGIVDWQCCVPEPSETAEVIRVRAPHTTMGSDPRIQRIVADWLARG